MPDGLFVIQELRRRGSVAAQGTPEDGERFEWSAARIPPGASGGARACPQGRLSFGGGKATGPKTQYPAALMPSRQMMGPEYKTPSFHGVWDDRWNFRGYAVGEYRRFEAMCRRSNPVRIQFEAEAFEGVIEDWDFEYFGDWKVAYQFTFEVHARIDGTEFRGNLGLVGAVSGVLSPGANRPTIPSPDEVLANVDLGVATLLDAHSGIPRTSLR